MLAESDIDFIGGLSTRVITAFRNDTFPSDFISKNPKIFLGYEWINVAKLRKFISENAPKSAQVSIATPSVESRLPKTEVIEQGSNQWETSVKNEPDLDRYGLGKSEIIEISSDEDESPKTKVEKVNPKDSISQNVDRRIQSDDKGKKKASDERFSKPFDASLFTKESETLWTDSDITSFVIENPLQVTTEMRVDRVEYLNEIPYSWPIPKCPTAFILDLRDKKFLVHKGGKDGKDLTVVTPDGLLKSKDQDSWKGGTGTADSTAMVRFQPGFAPILCRRSRLTCKGAYACSAIDPSLLGNERYELDPTQRNSIFEAQRITCEDERSVVEQRAATFLNTCRIPCPAVDGQGKKCLGKPRMRPKKGDQASRGHRYWIACDGWTATFRKNHRNRDIPDNVDEDILSKLISGQSLEHGEDTKPCSLVVSPHVGLKQALCPHPHIHMGRSDNRVPIKNYPCLSRRTIYIPIIQGLESDTSLRFALIVHPKNIPHNHPMAKNSKASYESKTAYHMCIEAAGILGATPQKIDQAPSTSLLLNGKTPGQYDSALYNSRLKQNMVRAAKKKENPAGLGTTGVFALFQKELVEKSVEDRYIQSYITTKEGGILIFTCVPALLSLIHNVTSFECDVTFKRVQGLNEWEMVIYYPPVQRAITIARVYTNKADTTHYEKLFDELQDITLLLTQKRLAFARFLPGGNLLCMNADMEAAQVLGAGCSFRKTMDLVFSKINVSSAEELLPFFVRVCLTHSKRGVLDFKALVSAQDYHRILDFPYMKSQDELDDFSMFISSLGVKKIQGLFTVNLQTNYLLKVMLPDWWSHKVKSPWIVSCILGSQSKIHPEHWLTTPATTNIGESQHHWSNKLTGIGLPLLEGIELARRVDQQVAEEVTASLLSGVLKNNQSTLFHQQNRAAQRLTSISNKSREAAALHNSTTPLREHIDVEKIFRNRSLAQQREFEASLKVLSNNKHMDLDLYEESSQLRKKIENEKDLRRKSTITQNLLTAELRALSGSGSGKPAPSFTSKRSRTTVAPEASSSGRVSILPSASAHAQDDYVGSNQLRTYSDEERFEEEDDPDAALSPDDFQVLFDDSFGVSEGESRLPTSSLDGLATDEEPARYPIPFDYYNSEPEEGTFTDYLNDADPTVAYHTNLHTTSNFLHIGEHRDIGSMAPLHTIPSSTGDDSSLFDFSGMDTTTLYPPSDGEFIWDDSIPFSRWPGGDLNFEMGPLPSSIPAQTSSQLFLPAPRASSHALSSPYSSPAAPTGPPMGIKSFKTAASKRPRLAEFDEANILPKEERRKRFKPARLQQIPEVKKK